MTQTVHEERRARLHPEEFKAGDTVGAGKFTLIEKLGEGGMGSVWLARDEQLSGDGVPIEVALKFIAGDRVPNATSISLLRKEVRASLRLSHPNIVRVHAWYENPGEPVFYSMEYMPGLDLKELLAQQPKGRFTFKELEPLVEQLFDALQYAHGEVGLVHRDLKPANLMVSRQGVDGPGGRLKLTDFGLARPDSRGDAYATTVGGTLLYASDGQRAGGAPCVADDIYSLSAVLYHLLTGHPPYAVEDLLRGGEKPPPVHPWHYLELKDRRDIPPEPAATLMRSLGGGIGGGTPAPDIGTFRRWWRTGPPMESFEVSRTQKLGGLLFGSLKVLGILFGSLLILVGLLWNSGLINPETRGWLSATFFMPLGWMITQNAPQVEAPIQPAPTNAPEPFIQDPKKPREGYNEKGTNSVTKLTATLSLVLDDASFRRWDPLIEVKELRPGGWQKVYGDPTISFGERQQLDIPKLPVGKYRVEAGDRHNGGERVKRNPRNWVVKEIDLVAGRPNVVELSMGRVRLTIYATGVVPFEIDDAWGNVYPITAEHFWTSNDSPFREARYKVDLSYPLDLLREGQLELRFPAEVMRQYRMEPIDQLKVVVGSREPILIPFVPWTHPRMDSSWTNEQPSMVYLPVGKGATFLAGQTEVTVGQYRAFAEETRRAVEPLESVTTNGWEVLGRTWATAFPGQTNGSPVVGVSWDDAMAFCEWLTARERRTNRLSGKQRYTLPTAEHWTRLASDTEYPWGSTYPPGSRDGNYAGQELRYPNWPGGWEDLTLDSADADSVWTVPVGQLRPDSRGFLGVGGNAAEWCDTWYEVGMNASISWAIPSKRLSDDGGGRRYRVVRGASWADSDRDLLKTKVHWAELPGSRKDRVGFRVFLVEEGGKP